MERYDPARWSRIEAVFVAALDLDTDARAAYLAQTCADDAALAAEVQAMLDADASGAARARLGQVVAQGVDAMHPTPVGRTIGAFVIERVIGHGGMGTVYLADRAGGDFHQRVAIKVLQHGVASPQLVARFRDERRILARLEHPDIVRLLDGGTTDDGVPYLIMEYVDGVPLARHARTLPLRARVELIARICDPLQHAHDHMIVHRDLKPGNILVTPDGSPKLLDFGIAKLLAPAPDRRAEHEATTRTGIALLTPEYASPEQARGDPVSAASDVYSLGAVMYELLVGEPPQRPGETVLDTLHAICERDAPRPSTVAPPALRRQLRGELDNIVLKALQKRPGDRYPSVASFADDLARYLDGRPVRAHAATLGYRARKFVRRHRGMLALAATIAAALCTATAVSVTQALRATRHARAERRQSVALLLEQGRQELLAGQSGRALPYLVAARRGGARGPALDFLTAEATRGVERELVTVDAIAAGVTGLAWSPDGARVALVGQRGAARMYDTAGALVASFDDARAGKLETPVFSHDGRWLAAAGADGRVWIWAVTTARPSAIVDAAVATPSGLAFAADGALAACARDGTVHLWSPDTGARLRSFAPSRDGAACAIAPDGSTFVNERAVVSLPDGAVRRPLDPAGDVTRAFLSRSGRSALLVSAGQVALWDVVAGAPPRREASDLLTVESAEFSADGARVVTTGPNRTAHIWDVHAGRIEVAVGALEDARIAHLSADGTRVVTVSETTFVVRDARATVTAGATTAAREIELPTVPSPSDEPHAWAVAIDMSFSPDQRRLLTATGTRFAIWNIDRAPLLDVITGSPLTGIAIAPDGHRAVTSGYPGASAIWDLGRHVRALDLAPGAVTLDADWSARGDLVAFAGTAGFVLVTSPDGSEPRRLRGHSAAVTSVAFAPDGSRLATGSDDRSARLWSVDGAPGPVLAHPHRVLGVAWSHDGTRVATAGWDGALRVWDARTGELVRTIDGGGIQFLEVEFGPRDLTLLACGHAGEVATWDLATGRHLASFDGHSGPVTAARFSPDGALLATSADDFTARIWDAASGAELARRRHDYAVMQLRWSADGRRLYTAGADGRLRTWDTAGDHRPLAALEEIVEHRGHWRLVGGRLERR